MFVSIFCDLQLPPLTPDIFFCFSNHQVAMILFLLLLSLPLSVLQWHHVDGNCFSEYNPSNRLFYIGYYYKCPLISYTLKNLFIIYFLWQFYLLYSPPAPHFRALKIRPLQCSKCPGLWAIQRNTSNIAANNLFLSSVFSFVCKKWHFSVKCFCGNGNSHLDNIILK